MTKEFIEELIQRTELQLKAMAYDGNNDQQLYANKRSLIDWLRRNPAMSGEDLLCPRCNEELYNRKHPVMQEGKEEKVYGSELANPNTWVIPNEYEARLPVDDEQPDINGLTIHITCAGCGHKWTVTAHGSHPCPNCTPPLCTS